MPARFIKRYFLILAFPLCMRIVINDRLSDVGSTGSMNA